MRRKERVHVNKVGGGNREDTCPGRLSVETGESRVGLELVTVLRSCAHEYWGGPEATLLTVPWVTLGCSPPWDFTVTPRMMR